MKRFLKLKQVSSKSTSVAERIIGFWLVLVLKMIAFWQLIEESHFVVSLNAPTGRVFKTVSVLFIEHAVC